MAEPSKKCKKLKTDVDELYFFKEFLWNSRNRELIQTLRNVISVARFGESGLHLTFLRINRSNASIEERFSKARVDVDVIKDEDDEIIYVPLAAFFLRGIEVLKNYFDENQPFITDDLRKRSALMNLLKFLKKEPTCHTESSGKEIEWKRAVCFAQHVLMPLVPQKRYCIDYHYCCGKCVESCCKEHQMDGEIIDTSYGCTKGWHGDVDLMIRDKGVPLSLLKAESERSDKVSDDDIESDVEMKTSEKCSNDKQQVIAQTIVFSFLQHKLNAKGVNCFVPGLGVSSEKLIFYMYDCVEDVLLCGLPLDLFKSAGKIRIRTAVVLWLLLNYDIFGNAFPPNVKKHKANFHDHLGKNILDMYMNEVQQPCHVNLSDKKDESEVPPDKGMIDVFTLLPESDKGTPIPHV
ncbi:hypothetical protein ACF0H5_022734 [Mactra antiquata]